jgi:hypothetical protein
MKKKEISLDLTKTKIKKFDEYIAEKLKVNEEIDNEEIKRRLSDIGLDLVNNKSGYKIDLTKYGEDII